MSVFSMIIDGRLPGRFVWREDDVVAFLSINPLADGHVLVVPVEEVDHFVDLDPALWARVNEVVLTIGRALDAAFDAPRVGTVVAGFEVPHLHVHVFPADDLSAFDFRNAAADPDPADLDAAAERVRAALRDLGHDRQVPDA